jgi:BirA family biotin operon repressor/biotin-[acetyl-CoA-carboxylase] ligase
VTQSLDLRRLKRGLANSPIRFELRHYARVNSTQDLVATAAATGANAGLVVLADEQLSGRGRSGRSWISPAGSSLMFSVLLRPAADPAIWSTLSLVAGLAVVEGLELAGGPSAQLKWPNDCLCRGRKLAGVLAESSTPSEGERIVVVGIGCNVCWVGAELPPDLRRTATACDLEGFPVDRTVLAEAVLGRLAVRYRDWERGGFGVLRPEWLRHAAWVGQEVIAEHRSGRVSGRAVGISDGGELLVETADGQLAIATGDLERTPGPLLRLADGIAR